MGHGKWGDAAGQDIRDRTFRFACLVVKFCRSLHEGGAFERLLAPQLLNCSTSTAAMLEEARGAESRRDFISKCSIGLKEARESHVRLRICEECGIGAAHKVKELRVEANEIVAILVVIVRNARARPRE
jgi:four helix bundle protein